MKPLNAALIQTDLAWENPEANRARLQEKIEMLSADIDLIVLPEMFTTGFSMHTSKLAEPMTGSTVKWMQSMAKHKNAAVMGSVIIEETKHYYNRFLFVHPNGDINYYDKKHTFTLAKEDEAYTSGDTKVIINFRGWKICPMICYDLRFPVWSRNTEDYDLLIYVASWPKKRIAAWDALLKARAIENMSYTIGVNRIGLDGNNYAYVGHSALYDALGKCLSDEQNEADTIILAELDKEYQETIRKKLGFLNDKDSFVLT